MIIRNLEESYEVVRELESDTYASYFLCKVEARPYELRLVVQVCVSEATRFMVEQLEEYAANSSFTDFCCTFLYGNFAYGVFKFINGENLEQCLEEGDTSVDARAQYIQKVLEKVIIQNLPEYLICRLLTPKRLIVPESAEEEPGFIFGFQEPVGLPSMQEQLAALCKLVFVKEEAEGLYPELTAFYETLESEKDMDAMAVYQAYLLLLPAFLTERMPPVTKKEPFVGKILLKMKTILGIVAMAMVVGTLWGTWNHNIYPAIETAYLVKQMPTDSEDVEGYYGKVELTSPDTGSLIWKGRMEEGKLSGYGKEYYDNGKLKYEGELFAGMYGGQGSLYDREGRLLYKGIFKEHLYDGEGVLYDIWERISYQGEFAGGKKEGEGSLYDNAGNLVYEGGFKKDKPEGTGARYKNGVIVERGEYEAGVLGTGIGFFYDEEGIICYEGEIKNGMRDGEGISYEKGMIFYEGGFSRNQYEGQGKEYSKKTGHLIYSGGFERGKRSGEGSLYDETTDVFRYQGSFRLGVFDGEGMEYDSGGNLRYEGHFSLGTYNGKGTLYNSFTGVAVLEGIFRNGMLVTPDEDIKEDIYDEGTEAALVDAEKG